jgi:hypothetical protein
VCTVAFDELIGKILTEIVITKDLDVVTFTTSEGQSFIMHHHQDCCECVWVEDICGDLDDLLHTPVLQAFVKSHTRDDMEMIKCYKEEATKRLLGQDKNDYDLEDSATWTFYTIVTFKGSVTIRWCGTSNGYYSEEVSFEQKL